MVMSQYDTWRAGRCLHKLYPFDIGIQAGVWNTSVAMDSSPCTISPHSPGWECPLNLVSFGGISWRIWPNVTHSRLTDASQSFFTYHIYTSKVLQYFRCNGWLSLSPVIPVSRLIVDPKSGILVGFLAMKSDGYGSEWHIWGYYMPSNIAHLSKVGF